MSSLTIITFVFIFHTEREHRSTETYYADQILVHDQLVLIVVPDCMATREYHTSPASRMSQDTEGIIIIRPPWSKPQEHLLPLCQPHMPAQGYGQDSPSAGPSVHSDSIDSSVFGISCRTSFQADAVLETWTH